MEKLTNEQKKQYLANEGVVCPFCQSDDVVSGSVETDSGYATQDITCNVCDEEWTDVYTLTGVETDADRPGYYEEPLNALGTPVVAEDESHDSLCPYRHGGECLCKYPATATA
jgi:hypothetical protein